MSSPSPSSASSATDTGPRGVIPAVLLVSAAAIADEIVLIRLLSVRFWPHFVPMIVSQAMLGLGAAGVAIQLLLRRLQGVPDRTFAWAVLLCAPAFDLAYRASLRVPFDPFLLMWEPAAWPAFALFFFLLSVPFFLAGFAVSVPLAFPLGKPGAVYGASFGGSAAGAVLALPAFSFLPTESLLRVPPFLCLCAAGFILRDRAGRLRAGRVAALGSFLLVLALPSPGLSPSPYKDLAAAQKLPGARTLAVRSGPAGDYRALFAPGIHSAPGLSLRFDGEIPPQAAVFGDGESRGIVPEGGGKEPPAYLDYLPAALAYRLVPRPAVLQFGLRGSEGILAAARGGASAVTIVEPAPEHAALVADDLSVFGGGWPASLRPEILAEGARNVLARERRRFDVIEIAGISSPTFSSLGIHATGETFLLTREGIRAAFERLSERGVLSITGWIKVPPRESVKILRTIRADLEATGSFPASSTLIVIRGWGSFAIAARRVPFSRDDLARVDRFCDATGFEVVWPPPAAAPRGEEPERKAFREAAAAAVAGPARGAGDGLFDLRPVTDDSPYFHRFLRLRSLPEFRRLLGSQWVPFVEWGVVFLLLSLAVSLVLAAAFLLLPLAFASHRTGTGGVPSALYFAALGLGYMVIELTFLKVGILVLGDAIRAAAAAIGGFAFFSGLGSALSGRWETDRTMKGRVFPGIAVLATAGFSLLALAAPHLLARGTVIRLALFLAALAPPAFLMGMPFPTAVSRLSRTVPSAIPFALGVNGFFSVAGATLASVGALWAGFRGTLLAGVALYLLAGALFARLGDGPCGGAGRPRSTAAGRSC